MRRLAFVLAAALAALASPAAAQQEGEWDASGRRIDPMNERALGEERSYRLLTIVADCMSGHNPRTTWDLLAAVPESDAQTAALMRARPMIERCMLPAMRMSHGNGLALNVHPLGYRGAFAESMLRRLGGVTGAVAPAGAASGLIRHFEQDPNAAAVAARNRIIFIFYDAASCVVRQDWAGVGRFLATAPRSPEERTQLRALSATIGGCLQPGVTVSIEPRSFRGVLAESALYALASHNYSRRPAGRSR